MRGPYKARPAPGTWADLIQQFKLSQRYRDWAPNTRRKNDPVLQDFMAENGRQQVSTIRRSDVLAMRDSMGDTPAAANNWLKVIRVLLDFAVDREFVERNVARDRVPGLRPKAPGGFRSWREDEIDAFVARWPIGTIAHRVLTLALCTGAARIDLVTLGWGNIANGRIRYRREKTRREEEDVVIDLPVLPALAELLATIPRTQMTFLETRDGQVRSEKGLTSHMQQWVAAVPGLGAPDAKGVLRSLPDRYGRHLNVHGLRKAVGRRLAEAGCSPYEVASVLGHRSVKSSEVYTRAYDRARSADSAADKLNESATKSEHRVRTFRPAKAGKLVRKPLK